MPTTYAGSEVTNILGQTADGVKTTLRGAKVVPEVVLYDPELTLGLPVGLTVTSGLNAIAHAIEALYAPDRNPVTTLMASEGVRALRDALPGIVANPADIEARSDALYGAWLCGTVLGTVAWRSTTNSATRSAALSICRTPRPTRSCCRIRSASTPRRCRTCSNRSHLFGASPGPALYDFARSVGAPSALRELGLAHPDLDRAAHRRREPLLEPPPGRPRRNSRLLEAAWAGSGQTRQREETMYHETGQLLKGTARGPHRRSIGFADAGVRAGQRDQARRQPADRAAAGFRRGGQVHHRRLLAATKAKGRNSRSSSRTASPTRTARPKWPRNSIVTDKINLMLVASTPETTNPVSTTCEAEEMPCISTVGPGSHGSSASRAIRAIRRAVEAVQIQLPFLLGARGRHRGLHQYVGPARDQQEGRRAVPNDGDGNAWGDAKVGFRPVLTEKGLR